jgi:hypothetical protein
MSTNDDDAILFAKSAVEFDRKNNYELAISYYLVNDSSYLKTIKFFKIICF